MSPRRSSQQAAGDAGVLAFRSALPDRWVSREESNDYGIDVNVEIFAEDGTDTGLRFHAQVKSTGSDVEGDIFSFHMKFEWLEYYRKLAVPVLIVRYSSSRSLLVYRWAHSVRLAPGGGETPTVKIEFDASRVVSEDAAPELEQAVHGFRYWRELVPPLPIDVALTVDKDPSRSRALAKKLQNDPTRPDALIRFRTGPASLGQVDLISDDAGLIVSVSEVSTASISLPLPLDHFHGWWLIEHIQVLLAFCLQALGRNEQALKMLPADLGRAVADPGTAYRVADLLLASDRNDDVFGLWEGNALRTDGGEVAWAITAAVFHAGPSLAEGDIRRTETVLDRWKRDALDRGEVETAMSVRVHHGQLLFNLARYRDAFRAFAEACRIDSRVEENHWWLRDLAATLFELGRYRAAERLYTRIVEETGDPRAQARLADTLMFAGRYLEASMAFDVAVGAAATAGLPIEASWALRHQTAATLAEAQSSQRRDEVAAREALESQGPIHALAHDGLFAEAWSQLAADQCEDGRFDEAAESFLLAAAIDHSRLGDMVLALRFYELAAEGVELIALMDLGIRVHGVKAFLDALEVSLSEQGLADEEIDSAMAELERALETYERSHARPEDRMLVIPTPGAELDN